MELALGKPSEKQQLVLQAKTHDVGFGGARGGGKSWLVRFLAVVYCLLFKGIKCIIIRKTYPELYNNHIRPLCDMLQGIARYNDAKKLLTFPGGSTIQFGYCACDKDLERYQGGEWDIIFLEEATNLRQEWIEKIRVCCRGTNGFPKRVYWTFNPGGVSHGYIKRLFIDRRYENGEDPEDYSFIQSLVTDNKVLMAAQPEYVRQLEALPPKLRKAWLEGRWDIFEGQYFEEFRLSPDLQAAHDAGCDMTQEELLEQHRWTHVVKPFDLASPRYNGWSIYRSYDFGYGKPFSCGWWAVSTDGVCYRVLELYGCTAVPNEGVKWTPDQQFARIREIEQTHPWLKGKKIQGVADPAIWDASRGESIAETATKYGVYFSPGDNRRIPGWMQLRYRLRFDSNGYAKMYFFDTCKAIIRCMPLMMYDDHDPEDLDTELEDHCLDDTRYFCMARPIAPPIDVAEKPIYSDPLNQMTGK